MAAKRTLWSSLAIIVAMLMEFAMAANYTVGAPNGGWDTSTQLQVWASSQSFLVGDNLIFQYDSTNHDVVEVRKSDYDSCQPNNPIQTYNDGTTSITLSSPGKRYFICGTLGHCGQGMKLEIDTLATSPSPSPTPSSSPFSPPEASPSIPPSSSLTPSLSPGSPAYSSSPESEPTTELPPLSSPVVPSTGSSPDPSASSSVSYKGSFIAASLTVGFCFIVMMILDLQSF
ncbi:uclacyanin 1 [Ziziphus jujuba]|uniref:Uclacyanin 1 n=1 Tax=Ziziphus jujuba TaxID=326968 RepID=A0A6P3ZPM9_ZIZJJ|nr:uclacyanin 1 [Ziziphus jujuba]